MIQSQQSLGTDYIIQGVKKVSISEEVKGNEEKVKVVKSKADEIIDMYPQQSFVPNC